MTIRMLRAYIITFAVSLLVVAVPAYAYHFPWDQGHDTTNWNKPPDPGTCKESTCDPCRSTSSPVYTPTGHFIWTDTDIALKGRPLLQVSRTYNSQDSRDGVFGNGWSASFDIGLYPALEGGVYEYYLRAANGKRYIYPKQLVQGTYVITSPPGRFEQVVPQADGSARLVNPDGSYQVFRKDGKLISDVDRNGNAVTYKYDTADRLIEAGDGNGRSLAFAYNSGGRISHVTDHGSRTWKYDYDIAGNLISVTDPLDGVRQYEYAPYTAIGDGFTYQHLTRIIDPSGVVVNQIVYNNERVQSYTESENRYTYSYDTVNKRVTKTDTLGTSWKYLYNSQGIITNEIDPFNNQTTFTFDANGLLTQMTDQAGKPWASSYDSQGRMLTTSNPLNETKTLEYTGTETSPTKLTTPSGRVYNFAYDGKGNILSVTDPVGAQAKYAWNAKGDLVIITNTLGNKETIAYNVSGLPVTVTDPLNRVVTYSYDTLGNMLQVTNPAGEKTGMAYDVLGKVTSVINPLGHVTSFSYDIAGRLTSVTDPNGGITGYKYDAYGRLIEKTAPDGRKHTYVYRTDNQLNSATDPKSQTTTYAYDSAKRLTEENAAGEVTTFSYSTRNQMTSMSNSSGTVSAIYDDVGRLSLETNNGKTIQYAYNTEGRRLSFTALGTTTNYAYDNRGLLTAITSPSGLFTFRRDLMGRPTSLKHPNNDVISYQYDAACQLTGITSVGIVNTNYGYERDAVGRITRWTGDGSDWFYQYDAAGRLVQAGHGPDNFAYTYDPLGNMLDNGRTHDIANRLLQDNDYTYSYDLNGNLTKKQNKATGARTVYIWNARNQLARVDRYADTVVATPSKTFTFAYDWFGRRVSRSEDGVEERYVYDGNNLIALLNSARSSIKKITFGPGVDRPVGSSDGLTSQFYYVNHQGSIMKIADNEKILNQYEYEPYGATNVSGEILSPFAYAAREQDSNDLYFYRTRYYSTTMQRFLSEDIIGLLGGINLYVYVQNNPINYTDPTGLAWFKESDHDYKAGRPNTIVPEGPYGRGRYIDDYVPAGHTFASLHDSFVGMATSAGLPDWLVNIPSMLPLYIGAVVKEMLSYDAEKFGVEFFKHKKNHDCP